MARLEQIQNRPQWTRSSHAVHVLDVGVAEIGSVKDQNFRDSTVATKMLGTRHVQLRGHDIGKLVKTESGVVTVGALRNFLTILRPKIPEHQIGAFRSGKSREPIDSTVLPDPVSHLNMVGVGFLGNARANGLFGRKKALLGPCCFVQPPCSLFVFGPTGIA